MRAGGRRLREKYSGFLPALASPETVRVYTTDFPRTVQSVQALLQGLYPLATRHEIISIDATRGESMIPDPVPRGTALQAELEAAVLSSEAVQQHAAEIEPLRIRCSDILRETGTVDPVAYTRSGMGAGDEPDGHLLSWNKLAEILKCLGAYDRLPPGLTDADVSAASLAGAYRWTALMRDSRIARLAMGKMAADIVSAARDAARGAGGDATCERLVLWSAHDSTLFGLLAAFGLDAPAAWPPYAAMLCVELFEELEGHERPRGFYVRFSLNGEALMCAIGSQPTCLVALDELASAVHGVDDEE